MDDKPGGQSGGVSIVGSQVNVQGDIVGGPNIKIGVSPAQIDQLFRPLLDAVAAAKPEHQAEAASDVSALKHEIAKGKDANDGTMAKLVDHLVELVPSAAAAIAGAFGTPVLAGIAGPVTTWVLNKLQGK
ncbi:MAG TPA: hypothetical protein VGR47_09500 [Terracidiphilus sp.]|nr:hypothetical protein [Terracidiphilus sp.]